MSELRALTVHGHSRARWCIGDKAYTPAGIEIPQDVMANDEQLIREGRELPPDIDVLPSLEVTLPKEALPEGAVLSEPPRKPGAKVEPEPAKQTVQQGKAST
jgi:hypothetical protein